MNDPKTNATRKLTQYMSTSLFIPVLSVSPILESIKVYIDRWFNPLTGNYIVYIPVKWFALKIILLVSI